LTLVIFFARLPSASVFGRIAQQLHERLHNFRAGQWARFSERSKDRHGALMQLAQRQFIGTLEQFRGCGRGASGAAVLTLDDLGCGVAALLRSILA
jgi:hypothetical protein